MLDKRLTWFARLVGVSALAGCSFLYNPSNLASPASDASVPPPDQPTIISANDLSVNAAGPAVLLEGQGTGGSRPAILAIIGANIAQEAKLALVPSDGSTGPKIEVDNDHAVRSLSGTGMAVPVTLPVDPSRGAGDVKLTVKITQAGTHGEVTATLDGEVTLRNLPELDQPITDGAALAPLYSRVKLSAPLAFAPKAGGAPVVIRAVSSIELVDVHVDAVADIPGSGGASGGTAGARGLGVGAGFPAALLQLSLAVVIAGSGGGYGEAGGPGKPALNLLGADDTLGGPITGDELILAFATSGGSGGGGGAQKPGGGSGGSLEITAGGTLKAGAISANGGTGGADSTLNGAAGGGSGGAIIVRSGSIATFGAITANGGAGGDHGHTGNAAAGAGGGGRLRYDVPTLAGNPALPTARRPGVSFDTRAATNPLVTTDAAQGVSVTSTVSASAAHNVFDVYVFNAAMATTDAQTFTFVTPSVILRPKLSPGYNRICVTPHGASPLTATTATNCLDLAYVP